MASSLRRASARRSLNHFDRYSNTIWKLQNGNLLTFFSQQLSAVLPKTLSSQAQLLAGYLGKPNNACQVHFEGSQQSFETLQRWELTHLLARLKIAYTSKSHSSVSVILTSELPRTSKHGSRSREEPPELLVLDKGACFGASPLHCHHSCRWSKEHARGGSNATKPANKGQKALGAAGCALTEYALPFSAFTKPQAVVEVLESFQPLTFAGFCADWPPVGSSEGGAMPRK